MSISEPPKDCVHAYSLGVKNGFDYRVSGEFLISPDPGNVEPFMVYCDFETFQGKGKVKWRHIIEHKIIILMAIPCP